MRFTMPTALFLCAGIAVWSGADSTGKARLVRSSSRDAVGPGDEPTAASGVEDPGASARSLVCNTFSICALDPETGETGVAVTTRVPEVGRLCPWAKAGVGAVATQATVEVSYGPRGLELLEQGLAPDQVIERLLAEDENRAHRQLGIIDAHGNTASHTGKECMDFAGHRAGKNYTVQGNLLVGKAVIDATAESFEATAGTGRALADRLIAALEAGQRAGGDKRKGLKQSAALIVADPGRTHYDGTHITVNMQVAEHPEPVAELRRQYDTIHQRLGYREFRWIAGRDVIELKALLHALGCFRDDENDDAFRNRLRGDGARSYDADTAAAVDRFRKDHNLPVPDDQLGHDAGVVDAPFVHALYEAYGAKRKAEPGRDGADPSR